MKGSTPVVIHQLDRSISDQFQQRDLLTTDTRLVPAPESIVVVIHKVTGVDLMIFISQNESGWTLRSLGSGAEPKFIPKNDASDGAGLIDHDRPKRQRRFSGQLQ